MNVLSNRTRFGSSIDKYSPYSPFQAKVDTPVPDAYVSLLAQPVEELDVIPSNAVFSGYEPELFELALTMYPLCTLEDRGTSGYFFKTAASRA